MDQARIEKAVAEVNAAWTERWKARDSEWREIIKTLKAKWQAEAGVGAAADTIASLRDALAEVTQQRDEALAAGGLGVSSAMQSALSLAAQARDERDAAVRRLGEANASSEAWARELGGAKATIDAQRAEISAAHARAEALARAAEQAECSASAAGAVTGSLEDRTAALEGELAHVSRELNEEKALGAKLLEVSRKLRDEISAQDSALLRLRVEVARSVRYLQTYASRCVAGGVGAGSSSSSVTGFDSAGDAFVAGLAKSSRGSLATSLSYWSAKKASRLGGGGASSSSISLSPHSGKQGEEKERELEDAAESALAAAEAATPESLREAVRRCVEEAGSREEAGAAATEALRRELSTLKREAVLEIRKLRAMMEAMGGGKARGSTAADFAAPPGASLLDGSFAAAVVEFGAAGSMAGTLKQQQQQQQQPTLQSQASSLSTTGLSPYLEKLLALEAEQPPPPGAALALRQAAQQHPLSPAHSSPPRAARGGCSRSSSSSQHH